MVATSPTLFGRLRHGGNEADWRRLVVVYTPLIHHTANKYRLPQSGVDDVVQDVLTILVRELPRFDYDPKKSFRSWLLKITRNAAIDYLRKIRGPIRREEDHPVDELVDPIDVDDASEFEHRRYLLSRAFVVVKASVEEQTWKAFWETTINRQPAIEVAKGLEMSVASVYTAKSRVLAKLREVMNELSD